MSEPRATHERLMKRKVQPSEVLMNALNTLLHSPKDKKESWIQEHMRIYGVGREKAEKKYRTMRCHGLV